ncbi:MAG: CvpA family protein [Clostridia bacterium]
MPGYVWDIIIGVIVLISLLVGFKRGFVKTTVLSVAVIISFAISFFVCDDMAKLIDTNTKWNTNISTTISKKIVDIDVNFEIKQTSVSALTQCVELSKMNDSQKQLFNNYLKNANLDVPQSVASIVSPQIATKLTNAISFVSIFVVILLIATLISAIAGKYKQSGNHKKLNIFFGGISGIINGGVCIMLIFIGILVLCQIPVIGEFVGQSLPKSYVSKYLYFGAEKVLLFLNGLGV